MKKLLMTLLLSTAFAAQAAPIVNIFELGIQANQTEQYDEVGRYNITKSVGEEKGTLAMYSLKRADNLNLAYMIEIYQDNDAYQTHIKSEQYQYFIKKSPEILTDHKKKIAVEPQFLGDKPFTPTRKTRTNLVRVAVKPEYNHQFKDIVLTEMAQSLKHEKGVLAMYAMTEKDAPNVWYFFEIYASDAAYAKHRQQTYFQDYLRQTVDLVADKETIAIKPSFMKNKGNLQFIDYIKNK